MRQWGDEISELVISMVQQRMSSIVGGDENGRYDGAERDAERLYACVKSVTSEDASLYVKYSVVRGGNIYPCYLDRMARFSVKDLSRIGDTFLVEYKPGYYAGVGPSRLLSGASSINGLRELIRIVQEWRDAITGAEELTLGARGENGLEGYVGFVIWEDIRRLFATVDLASQVSARL